MAELPEGFHDKRRSRTAYHYYRLHPFSLRELAPEARAEDLEALMTFGGFPEPLFRSDATLPRRWLRERADRVLREDLRDLEQVKEISATVFHLARGERNSAATA